MNIQIRKLKELTAQSQRLVAFTGAGISTESGIPDFRSPGGVWTKYKPVTFQEFLSSDQSRIDYWQRYTDFFPPFTQVRPNLGHLALAELEKRGRLIAVITQNIDRLHQAAGVSPDKVIELHGRIDETVCLSCSARIPTGEAVDRVLGGERVPVCRDCGGWLKPATISFGQNLSEETLTRAFEISSQADLFLAVGSSLLVQPAASLPGLALQSGARLVIINAEPTPYDQHAHLVINDRAGATLSALISES